MKDKFENMTKNKKILFVGICASAIATVIHLISEINTFSKMSTDDWTSTIIAFILAIIYITFLFFLELRGYFRFENSKKNVWKIFFLIIGIIEMIWAIVSVSAGDILGGMLAFIQGVCFILSFVMKDKTNEK